MRVKCLAQEHNAVPQPGVELGLFDPESSTLTISTQRASHNNKKVEQQNSSLAINKFFQFVCFLFFVLASFTPFRSIGNAKSSILLRLFKLALTNCN